MTTRSRLLALPFASLLLAASECTPPQSDAGPGDVVEFDCELGVPTADRETFAPLTVDDETELQLGFQGLSFAVVRVRAAATAPRFVQAGLSARVDGSPEAIGAEQDGIELRPLPDGTLLTSDILIPMNRGSFADYVGKSATVAVRLADSLRRPTAACICEGVVRFVDEDRCVHTGDEPICPDAGPSADDADGGGDGGIDGSADGGAT